ARLPTLVGAAHVDKPLALPLVLALAGVLRALAASFALAGIDAGALDPSAGLVRGTRHDIAGQYESCRCARDEHPSPDRVRSAVHSCLLPLSGCGFHFTAIERPLRGARLLLLGLRLPARAGCVRGGGEQIDLDRPFGAHDRRQLLHPGEPADRVLRADPGLLPAQVLDLRPDA